MHRITYEKSFRITPNNYTQQLHPTPTPNTYTQPYYSNGTTAPGKQRQNNTIPVTAAEHDHIKRENRLSDFTGSPTPHTCVSDLLDKRAEEIAEQLKWPNYKRPNYSSKFTGRREPNTCAPDFDKRAEEIAEHYGINRDASAGEFKEKLKSESNLYSSLTKKQLEDIEPDDLSPEERRMFKEAWTAVQAQQSKNWKEINHS